MKIGCFALVEPFTPLERQFELIRSMGIEYVDLTDNHDGASLGVEFGFAASISLDSNPAKIRGLAARHKLKLSTVCAHANLLDPPAPDVYGTFQIIKAIRLAADLGIPEVITTEGDGVVGIPAVVKALKKTRFDGTTTLEIAGAENVKISAQRLRQWSV